MFLLLLSLLFVPLLMLALFIELELLKLFVFKGVLGRLNLFKLIPFKKLSFGNLFTGLLNEQQFELNVAIEADLNNENDFVVFVVL